MKLDTATWVGLTLAGRYEVLDKLGEGGMGCVYRAHDRNLATDVVVKVPRLAMLDDSDFAKRFIREIRSLIKLSHPHIVKVIDVGDLDGVPFAVLQYLAGGSLRSRQCQVAANRMSPESLLDWLPDIAGALDFIHGQKYIHRDIKPDNILFDVHGHTYLSDFGIAKVVAEDASKHQQTVVTSTGMTLGTPQYMAPELILGAAIDGRADQYALAVTIYEVLSGRYPFDGASPTAIFVQQTKQNTTRLDVAAVGVPKAFAETVHKALSKESHNRYPTCTDFARAVITALVGLLEKQHPRDPIAKGAVEEPEVIRLRCPSCSRGLRVKSTAKGQLTCPACKAKFAVLIEEVPAQSPPTPLRPAQVLPTTSQPRQIPPTLIEGASAKAPQTPSRPVQAAPTTSHPEWVYDGIKQIPPTLIEAAYGKAPPTPPPVLPTTPHPKQIPPTLIEGAIAKTPVSPGPKKKKASPGSPDDMVLAVQPVDRDDKRPLKNGPVPPLRDVASPTWFALVGIMVAGGLLLLGLGLVVELLTSKP